MEFEPPVDCARRLCPVLRQQLGCDVIIALGHMRLPNDRAFAFEAQAHVDAVLSGHDHDAGFELCGAVPVIKSGTEFWWLSETDIDLTRRVSESEVRAAAGAGVEGGSKAFGDARAPTMTEDEMLGSWAWGDGDVGDPDTGLEIKPGIAAPSLQTQSRLPRGQHERVLKHPFRIRLFETRATALLPPDERGLAVVAKWEKAVAERMAKELGETGVALDARFSEIRTRETNIGSKLCDLMRDAVHADCAILNGGTIRANSIIGPGKLTMRDLVSILPMQDPIVKLKVTGKQLVEALENGVSKWPQLEGRFPQVSGIKFAFDGSKPPGERVILESVRVRGKPLVPLPSPREAAAAGPSSSAPWQRGGTPQGSEASVSESSVSTTDVSEGPRITPPAAVALQRQGSWMPCMTDEGRPPAAEQAAAAAAAKCGKLGHGLTSAASFTDLQAEADRPSTPAPCTGIALARHAAAEPSEAAQLREDGREAGEAIAGGSDKAGAPSEFVGLVELPRHDQEDGVGRGEAAPEWWSKEFTLATKAYLAKGRDGYDCLAEADVLIDDENGPLLPNVLRTHLTALQALNGFKQAQHHTDRRRALAAIRRYARRFRSRKSSSSKQDDEAAASAAADGRGPGIHAAAADGEERGEVEGDDEDGGAVASQASSGAGVVMSAESLRRISRPQRGAAAPAVWVSTRPSKPGHESRLRIRARRRSMAMELSREDGRLPTLEHAPVRDGCTVPFVLMAHTHRRVVQLSPKPEAGLQ